MLPTLVRASAVSAASVAVEALLFAQTVTAARGALATNHPLDERLGAVLVTLGTGTALTGWTLWCVALAGALEQCRTRLPAPLPVGWRRVALLALGLTTLGMGTALPAAADPDPEPGRPIRLDGLALPVLPAAPPGHPPPDPARTVRSTTVHVAPGASAVVVASGDSLWSIAEDQLGGTSPPRAIDAAWRRWYAANRPTIGPDPDLLVPGQRLRAPAEPTDQPTDAETCP